jgi:predicted RNA-binding protein YlxR (DUF448 family)
MPDRRVTIDPTGRLAGRGAYLCRQDDCTRIGIRRALTQALEVPIPDELATELAALTMNTEGGARGQE